MTGSTLPESDILLLVPPSCHPVHRATALLEQSLLSAAPTSQIAGPFEARVVSLASPQAGTVNDARDTTTDAASPIAFFELGQDLGDARAQCQPPIIERVDVSALDASVLDDEEMDDMRKYAATPQLQGLVKAFRHSQRQVSLQVSLIVAGSIGAALALTLCLLLVFGATSSSAQDPANASAPADVSSLSPAIHHATETGPSIEPGPANAISDSVAEQRRIGARAGQTLALGPLLPHGGARYVLLRGLPKGASLSAGHHTSAGAWMVKGEDLAGLTLTLDDKAAGDHAIEIFLLDAGQGPEARRQLVLHVDTSPQIYAAGLYASGLYATGFGLRWPTLFPNDAKQAAAVEDPVTKPVDLTRPREGISKQIASGDIDTARGRLIELAERGHADAAYRLALTYDQEVLDQAGLSGVEGDMETAQAWYAEAAKAGHTEAAQRLEIIAKRRAGA